MSKYIKPCAVCGTLTLFRVQGTNFYPDEWVRGRKAIFDFACRGKCQETYLADIKKYCSLRVLLNRWKITRKEWENQGGE